MDIYTILNIFPHAVSSIHYVDHEKDEGDRWFTASLKWLSLNYVIMVTKLCNHGSIQYTVDSGQNIISGLTTTVVKLLHQRKSDPWILVTIHCIR